MTTEVTISLAQIDCRIADPETKMDLYRRLARVREERAFAWLREEYNRGVAIGGMCTGAHILAAAGLLSGYRATCHWLSLADLGLFGAGPVATVRTTLFSPRSVTLMPPRVGWVDST